VCDTGAGREQAAAILARTEYLGVDRDHLRRSLFADTLKTGTPQSAANGRFHIFNGMGVNRPSAEKANWIVNQLRLAGLLDAVQTGKLPALDEVFREDIYDDAIGMNKIDGGNEINPSNLATG
jgi:hypothetical protein